jgi:uncharacterized protein (TIGR02246 family)
MQNLDARGRSKEDALSSTRGIEMQKRSIPALLAVIFGMSAAPAIAAEVTEAELMQAATELGRLYDSNYAARNPAGMASLYATDGVLVSPAGPFVRGREDLTAYYTKRFATGAHDHAIKVIEVHVQGNGGYGLAQFSVMVPRPNGETEQVHGTIAAVYQHDPDGWHMRLVEPSVPEPAQK